MKLPHQAITTVHRSDGSGTTFNFTNYLSKVSPEWKSRVGEGTSVDWALKNGQEQAKALDYVPLPDDVIKQIEAHWVKELPGAWKVAGN